MASAQYDERRPVSVTLAGITHTGSYRVLEGTVIVYSGTDIRSAQYGMDRPETVARWVLLDMCKKAEAKKRKDGSGRSQLRPA
ncbi:hypothetical protein Q8F57_021010 [Paraburkholderia terrae]|uniref:hypothetical protein n=1 Tax=Paraburkholderia terrae TaxID=311230 RepID=UPI00296AD916|nr:hypothetical protein [Paraburkholderia terrae]MDW3661030.1 hypothetical protein [Paraburkholderia terrae]